MYKALSAGAINVHVGDLYGALEAAKIGGFAGVEFNAQEIANLIAMHDADYVQNLFAEAGVRPAAWGLPIQWRGTDAHFEEGLTDLPRLAQAAQAIGGPRTMTWIMPGSNDLDYDANYAFHVARFRPIAQILADYGCAIGLEFIGPKTLRDSQKYPFIYEMKPMLAMGQDIGPNVGLLLDCWHWHTSHGTLDDLRALKPAQVVYVHVNDAPEGIPTDEQVDNRRALPGATGVIDIAGFLQTLQAIGYDGPVTPEPFASELAALPSDEARLQTVGAAMDAIFTRAGLA